MNVKKNSAESYNNHAVLHKVVFSEFVSAYTFFGQIQWLLVLDLCANS